MAMQPCLYSTLRLLVRQFRDRSPPVPLHLAIACRDPCMAVLGPDPEEPGLCCSPWVHLRGPVHGARARTVLHRCSRKASYGFLPSVYRVTVDMRQHCTDGSFRFCRWRAHTEALSEDSGPEALSPQGQYFALQVFCAILQQIAGELSANCCRTITMTRYSILLKRYECRNDAGERNA